MDKISEEEYEKIRTLLRRIIDGKDVDGAISELEAMVKDTETYKRLDIADRNGKVIATAVVLCASRSLIKLLGGDY